MFADMQETLVIAMVLSAVVIVAAFISEGRGQHALRVLLGLTPRRGAAHIFDDVERSDSTWDIVGSMESDDTRELELARR